MTDKEGEDGSFNAPTAGYCNPPFQITTLAGKRFEGNTRSIMGETRLNCDSSVFSGFVYPAQLVINNPDAPEGACNTVIG